MRANVVVDVQRGVRVSTEYLDEESVPRIVIAGLPAHFAQVQVRGDYRTAPQARSSTGFLRTSKKADIRVGDRVVLRDSGETFEVRGRQRTRLMNREVLYDMERISGNSSR